MKKRKNKALFAVTAVVCMLAAISVFVFVLLSPYSIEGQMIAAELVPDKHMDTAAEDIDEAIAQMVSMYQDTGVNTAVMDINDGRFTVAAIPGFDCIYTDGPFGESDIVNKIKKALEKEKIQLFLSVDSAGLTAAETVEIVDFICKKYRPAAVVLENSADTQLCKAVADTVNRRIIKPELIIKTSDEQYTAELISSETGNSFICSGIAAADYTALKKTTDKKIYLHYDSPSMQSDIFVLTNFACLDGAVVGQADGKIELPYMMDSILSKNENLPVFGFEIPQQFNVTYPQKDISTYNKGIFVTGTGAAGQKVKINGLDYESADDGTFGIYITLEDGENVLNISQGDKSVRYTVTKKNYPILGIAAAYFMPWDSTQKVGYGQIVQTRQQLTSMLSDPDDDSAIIGNIEKDTKLMVVSCEETKRNNEKTWAYKLSNGGYVLASKVDLLNEVSREYSKPKKQKGVSVFTADRDDTTEYSVPEISNIQVTSLVNGDEVIYFDVNNNPAVLSDFEKDRLTLHFLDTNIGEIQMEESLFFTDCIAEQKDDGAYITFTTDTQYALWGYDISLTDTGVKLYLKQTPHKNSGSRPLEGIVILLDAGHGGNDTGALGVASTYGPVEKDLNLAVAVASGVLLEQYGAQVVMTREDDSYRSLDDRRNLVREVKPDLFISVHHNSMDYSYNSTEVRGSECYYFTHQSRKLAENLTGSISASANRHNRGAYTGYYYVTRTDIAPSVLMEYGFMINAEEFSKLYTDTQIYKAAYGTLQAVMKTIPEKNEI